MAAQAEANTRNLLADHQLQLAARDARLEELTKQADLERQAMAGLAETKARNLQDRDRRPRGPPRGADRPD